jgi:SAM-dependent methyltransferase
MSRRVPPKTASIATPTEGAKLIAPAASRNVQALCDLLDQVAPPGTRALELASGTGQHIIAFAAQLPRFQWQPTEIDAVRRASIDAYATGVDNVAPALALDATAPGWGEQHGPQDLIVLVNLLHLVSAPETEHLISQVAAALAPGGRVVLYGPFQRGGDLTSEGDRAFHASLVEQDPEIGYKDDFDIMDLLQDAGLEMAEVIEMPANNLALVAEKPAI